MNADKWRFILILLYNVVNDLGRQLSQVGTYTTMQSGEFATETSLNDYLFKNSPLSTDDQTKMFHDKIYGLYNLDNFAKWGALNPGGDNQKALLFELELRSYFGLSDAQIEEAKTNWQDIYTSNNNQFFQSLLNISPLKNNQGAGYY